MKITPWAGLGALAVLMALPAPAPAMGDGQTSPLRTRRMTVRVESPTNAPEAMAGAPTVRERVQLPVGDPSPAFPIVQDTAPETLDVLVDAAGGNLPEAGSFHVLDRPLAAPTLSSEVRAIIRAEAANLHMLDLQVER